MREVLTAAITSAALLIGVLAGFPLGRGFLLYFLASTISLGKDVLKSESEETV